MASRSHRPRQQWSPVPHDDPPHSHAHSHARPPLSRPASTNEWALWALTVVLALATILGVIVLWPDQGEIDVVRERGATIGLGAERLGAEVVSAVDDDCSYSSAENPQSCRIVEMSPSEGPDAGDTILLGEYNLADPQVIKVAPGDKIIVSYEPLSGTYLYADRERRAPLLWLAVLFAIAVVAIGRLRGVTALIALAATLGILVVFVLPSILSGHSPLIVAVVGCAAIAFVSLYLTHGVNVMTTVSLVGTLGALGLTIVLGWWFFELADFTGLISEETAFIPLVAPGIDVRGLLLGGVIIGALGALDDVVVTQSATVWEMRRESPNLGRARVFASAMRIGREHTGSIINTLVLAYAGASMPLLVLYAVSDQSLGIFANAELVALEIVRTLVGSIGLVAAVPVTTALAAYVSEPASSGVRSENDAG